MPRTRTIPAIAASPEDRISTLLAPFDAAAQRLVRAVRLALQQRFPTANELVYDYARKFVIGYSATAAGGQGLVALSADADGVRLYLTNGAALPDPGKLLLGKGGQARYIPITSAAELQRPEVEALLAAAERASFVPLPASGRGAVIIKRGAADKRAGRKGKP